MTQEELTKELTDLVVEYIDNFDRFDSNPQLRVNPMTQTSALVDGSDMEAEIADSVETIEDASAAHGLADQDSTDYQVKQNPDFYPVKKLLKSDGGRVIPDSVAIKAIAARY